MPINIDKQKLKMNKNIVKGASTAWIEQDLLVPDTKPDVVKILKVDSNIYISSKEIMDGSIRVTGQITYYIIYLSSDSDIRGINMSYPFVKVIEDKLIKKDMEVRLVPTIRNIIYSLPNERKISVKIEVIFRYKLNETGEIEIVDKINDCNSLECKLSKDTFFNIVENKSETFEAVEDIMIPESLPGIKEILRVTTEITNTEYKVSYNKILIKGEIKTVILYTSLNDNKEICTYTTNIPFTGMVEFSNISDSSKFDIEYSIKNFEISQDFSSDTGRMININSEIIADVMMYEKKEIEYIDDFYSMEQNLEYESDKINIIKNKESISKNITLKENVGIVPDMSKLLDYTIDISSLMTKVSGSNIYINGNIKVNVLYQMEENKKLEAKSYDLLLDTTIPLSKDIEEKYINVNMEVAKGIVRINGNNIETDIELLIMVDVDNVETINQINNIKEEKIDPAMFDSMNIYIVKKGDNLWNIAKKYKTSVAKIANINNLTDENKLDIGQKLLIIR